MRTPEFAGFIQAREAVRLNKEAGLPREQWTSNPILKTYRFCNVHRENDRVTRWVARNWREPLAGHPDLFFAMALARFLNWPPTLDTLPLSIVLPFRPTKVLKKLHERKLADHKVYGGAYIVSTNGRQQEKASYLIQNVLSPLWNSRSYVRPVKGDTLESFAARLMEMTGFQGFMVGQVIADLKYDPMSPLNVATDWWTWAVSGPGSRRGLNRLMGREYEAPWTEKRWKHAFDLLMKALPRELQRVGFDEELHAQDVQNCLCEFDKYERVRLNQGKPRSLYHSHEGVE